MRATAILTSAIEGGYTALNPETGTVSEGETVEEALGNLREAVALILRNSQRRTDPHPRFAAVNGRGV